MELQKKKTDGRTQSMITSKYAHVATKNPSWDKANSVYRQYENFSCKPATKKLRPDHVEDEDKSVKWNRQFVEDNNKKHAEEVKDLNQKKNALLMEAREMVKYLIGNTLEWKLTDADIDRYFDEWYDRYREDGFAYMCHHIECECNDIRKMDWWKSMKARKN
jgi:hypothetical protein